ncbi:uncharacterized protein LOC144350810 [Saccoglossus kowalevskii]
MLAFGASDPDYHARVLICMKCIRCTLGFPISEPFLRIPALTDSLTQCEEVLRLDQRNADMLLLSARVCVQLGVTYDACIYMKRSEKILGEQDPAVLELKSSIEMAYRDIHGNEIDWHGLYDFGRLHTGEIGNEDCEKDELLEMHINMAASSMEKKKNKEAKFFSCR